jgi:hypothetical protein
MQKAGYTAAAISKMHFGVPDSKMMRHYSKLCDEDTEREALEKAGAIPSEKKELARPDVCPECGEPCSPGVKFCPECGHAVTKAAINDLKVAREQIKLQPEYEELLKRLEKAEAELLDLKQKSENQ